ncbi:hypothetical protein ABPG72_016637 [Tetrahymena utriculariae]
MGCTSSNQVQNAQKIQNSKENQFQSHSYFIKENEKQIKDNYIIKNKLGEGSIGVVRRVIEKKTGEEKAMKVIPKNAQDKDQELQLTMEIDILKQLDHPSILKMYEFYQDKKNFYIITEIVKGGELFDKIVDINQFNEVDAAYIFNQIISVVQYIHEKKIMHRDLKPDNVLLEYDSSSQNSTKYSIKVIDWGSATFFDEKKQTKIVGTPFYIAPEVLRKSYTEKSDIWTCGIILYIMLTGEPPFFGKENEIVQNIIDCKFSMDQDVWKVIGNECKELIKQMICPEEKRLSAAQVQKHPWVQKHAALFKDTLKDSKVEQNKLQLNKLKKFTTKNRFHQAILTYISSQLTSKEDLLQFKSIFEKIDTNNDGQLTKDEIENGFKQFQEFFHGDYDIDKIFANVDLDGNGKINYTEFITACIQHENSIVDSKLQKAFEVFDSDGSNYLTKDELMEIFDSKFKQSDKESQIKQIFSQFDTNGDEQISFDEFKLMMKKYAETS